MNTIDAIENIPPKNENYIEKIKLYWQNAVRKMLQTVETDKIIAFLSSKNTTQEEGENFILSLPMLSVEEIIPILCDWHCRDFHYFLIDHRMQNLDLDAEKTSILRFCTPFQKLISANEIDIHTLFHIFRTKNHKKYPFKKLFPYIQNSFVKTGVKQFFLRTFLEEQNWNDVKKIFPRKSLKYQDNSLEFLEPIFKISGFLPFCEIRPFLEDENIADSIKSALAWKSEFPLQKEEMFPFLHKNKNLPHNTLKNLAHKLEKNLTMEEIFSFQNHNIFPFLFVARDPKISDDEILHSLQNMALKNETKYIIFWYLTKNYSNISASQSENIDKNKNFVLGKFLSTGLSVYSGDEIIKRHFSAYQSEENMLQTILLPKLKQFPEKNIYDIEREIVKNFLKNISIIPDEIRDENTKNILKYQKKFVTEDEYRHAKNIFLNDENFELTLYIRYKHCVDYPDIAEFVGIFLDEYISSGRSKIFKNLRILPRNDMAEVNISPFIKSLKSAKYYNVVGLDASAVMNIFATTFYLSHSANAWKHKIPSVISHSMASKAKENDIISEMELEIEKMSTEQNAKIKGMYAYEICQEILENIQKLEEKLLMLSK